MGHSTGCQDVMEYLVGKGSESRPKIDGGILQAGISDREAMHLTTEGLDETVKIVQDIVKEGKSEDVLPFSISNPFFSDTPITAYRFLSLATKGGDDDYFSTDLEDEVLEQGFGKIPEGTGFCVVLSGSDEYMGEDVDKKELIEKWLGFAKRAGAKVDGNSGVVEEATHNLKGCEEGVMRDLVERVVGFLKFVEEGVDTKTQHS